MMKINLVPESLRKQKKTRWVKKILKILPLEVIIGVTGGVVIVLAVIHIFLQGIIFFQLTSHTRAKASWEQLLPQKRQVDVVLQEIKSLEQNIALIEKMTIQRRILWAPKLNVISDQIPPGVWLQRIALQDHGLLIEGSSVSRQGNEMISVSHFSANLKNQDIFMQGFRSIEISSIKRRMIKDIMAADFSIFLKLDERPKE